MAWFQSDLQLPAMPPGLHDITRQVLEAVPEIGRLAVGILHVFIQHTSASLTINEAADPDVVADLDRVLDVLAPEDFPYDHTVEGPDDMPGHVKSSLLGSSVSVPIRDGQPRFGTWQGIFLCEHRRRSSGRHLVVTVQGDLRPGPSA